MRLLPFSVGVAALLLSVPALAGSPSSKLRFEDHPLRTLVESERGIQTHFDRTIDRMRAGRLLQAAPPRPVVFTKTTVGVAVAGGRAECADSATGTRIVPGDREASLLWQKVNGTQDCGDAMPPPGKGTRLTKTELARLGLYIDALSE